MHPYLLAICLGIEIRAPMNMNRLQKQHQPEKHEDYTLLNIIQCRIIDPVTSIYVRKLIFFHTMFVLYCDY